MPPKEIIKGILTVALIWFAAGLEPYLLDPSLWPQADTRVIQIGQGLVGITMAACLGIAAFLMWKWAKAFISDHRRS